MSPLIAARREGQAVRLAEVVRYIDGLRPRFDGIVIEGAGGLLSPLGEDFDSRDLIKALDAVPVIVAANRLGVLNAVLLTLEALPARYRRRAVVALVASRRTSLVRRTNHDYLVDRLGTKTVREVPFLPDWPGILEGSLPWKLMRSLAEWVKA